MNKKNRTIRIGNLYKQYKENAFFYFYTNHSTQSISRLIHLHKNDKEFKK